MPYCLVRLSTLPKHTEIFVCCGAVTPQRLSFALVSYPNKWCPALSWSSALFPPYMSQSVIIQIPNNSKLHTAPDRLLRIGHWALSPFQQSAENLSAVDPPSADGESHTPALLPCLSALHPYGVSLRPMQNSCYLLPRCQDFFFSFLNMCVSSL